MGAMLSSTVMVAVHVLTLLLTSVTVKVTVLAPRSVQSKLLLSSVIVAMPQLSDDTVVHLSCRDGSRSVGVKLNRQVLADRSRGHVVL